MLLDDAHMRSVSILTKFLLADPGWQQVHDWEKTIAFRKVRDQVLDVAWHMQPWTVDVPRSSQGSALKRLYWRLRNLW